MEAFTAVLLGVLKFLGSIGLTMAFIIYMIKKQGWKFAQIMMGVLFGFMLAAVNPTLPVTVYTGINNIINAVSK